MTEQDRPSWRPIAATLGAVLGGIALSALAVYLLGDLQTRGGGRTDVVTPMFTIASERYDEITTRELQRMARIQRLHSWTWVDPEHRRVRMPIERAIDRYLEEHR